MRRRLSRPALCLAALAALPGSASGGAWTRAAGDGISILTLGWQGGSPAALAHGGGRSDKAYTSSYVEYGITDRITAGLTTYADLPPADPADGTALAGGFVRGRIWRGSGGSVVSAEIGGAYPVASLGGGIYGATGVENVAEIRGALLWGTSWWGGWGSAYVSTGAGFVARLGAADQVRAEATLGYDPWRCCSAALSAFLVEPVGTGPTARSDRSFRLSPSLAWHVYPGVGLDGVKPQGHVAPTTVQAGLSYDLRQPGDGIGLQLSLWMPF